VKKRRLEGESYKRKSNIGGWILFVIVVAGLVVYLRAQPKSEAVKAMGKPDEVLQYFSQVAYNVSHLQTGSGPAKSTIDELLDLCTDEDKEWFQNNYERIYARSGGDAVGANPHYTVKRNVAIQTILDNGVNRTDYKILNRKSEGNKVEYRVQIPGPYNTSRMVNVTVKKVKGRWRVDELGGGKMHVL
jgi:hypothetical protein